MIKADEWEEKVEVCTLTRIRHSWGGGGKIETGRESDRERETERFNKGKTKENTYSVGAASCVPGK